MLEGHMSLVSPFTVREPPRFAPLLPGLALGLRAPGGLCCQRELRAGFRHNDPHMALIAYAQAAMMNPGIRWGDIPSGGLSTSLLSFSRSRAVLSGSQRIRDSYSGAHPVRGRGGEGRHRQGIFTIGLYPNVFHRLGSNWVRNKAMAARYPLPMGFPTGLDIIPHILVVKFAGCRIRPIQAVIPLVQYQFPRFAFLHPRYLMFCLPSLYQAQEVLSSTRIHPALRTKPSYEQVLPGYILGQEVGHSLSIIAFLHRLDVNPMAVVYLLPAVLNELEGYEVAYGQDVDNSVSFCSPASTILDFKVVIPIEGIRHPCIYGLFVGVSLCNQDVGSAPTDVLYQPVKGGFEVLRCSGRTC